jgi:hypothetical protein
MARRWLWAGAGLLLAGLGGGLETRGDTAAGAVLAVAGLILWVVASGSALADPAAPAATVGRPAGRFGRRRAVGRQTGGAWPRKQAGDA